MANLPIACFYVYGLLSIQRIRFSKFAFKRITVECSSLECKIDSGRYIAGDLQISNFSFRTKTVNLMTLRKWSDFGLRKILPRGVGVLIQRLLRVKDLSIGRNLHSTGIECGKVWFAMRPTGFGDKDKFWSINMWYKKAIH